MIQATLIVSPQARHQADRIHTWWRAKRAKAPNLFLTELVACLEHLAGHPGIGKPYLRSGLAGVQRTLLRKTHYHVYYRFNRGANQLEIMAIWGARRRRGPRLW